MVTKVENLIAKILLLLCSVQFFVGTHANLINRKDEFESYEIQWKECGNKFLCGAWKVPIDHNNLNSDMVELQLVKLPARIQPPEKTIILHSNLGGTLLDIHGKDYSKILEGKVDFISLTTRASYQGRCKPNHDLMEDLNELLVGKSLNTRTTLSQAQIRYYDLLMKRFANSCYEGSAEYLPQ